MCGTNQIQQFSVERKQRLQLHSICHTNSHTPLPLYQRSLFREASQNKHPACSDLCARCSYTGPREDVCRATIKFKKEMQFFLSFFPLALLLGSKEQKGELMKLHHAHTCTVAHACKPDRLQCELIPRLIETSLGFYFGCLVYPMSGICYTTTFPASWNCHRKVLASQLSTHFLWLTLNFVRYPTKIKTKYYLYFTCK